MNHFGQNLTSSTSGGSVSLHKRSLPSVNRLSDGQPGKPLENTTGRPFKLNQQSMSGSMNFFGFVGSKNPKALTKRDLLAITTRLTIMLRSGVDLADAVRSISLRGGSQAIERAMGSIYSALESGKSLSQALEAERHQFGGVLVASAAAGEASGKLIDVLGRLTQILKDDLRLQNSIRSSLSYPVVLLVVTLLVMSAMLFFVLPQFGGVYDSAGTVVPPWTAVMLDISQIARQYWWGLILMVVALVVTCGYALRTPKGRMAIDRFVLRIPLLKTVFSLLLSGRLFRLQGALLSSGVAMVDVLRLTRDSTNNSCFTELSDEVERRVVNGEGVATALRECPFVPIEASEMVATAEISGQLGNVLQTLGDFYESEGEQKLRDVIKIAEPVIIVGMGLLIGAMVLSVMLPLLDLSSAKGL